MRAASPALTSYLAAVRAGAQPLLMADCFTFTLQSGAILAICDKDVSVTVGATTFLANGVRVSGLQYKCSLGLNVDSQELDIVASPTDLVAGVPVLQALRNGAFDGCAIQRDRAFLTSWTVQAVGSVTLFKGRLSTIDALGRTSARVTVASDLSLLDIQMPRNFYQPACNHTLYDAGCGLSKAAYGASGTAATGSSATAILWSGATQAYVQGTLTMTSGANAGVSTGVKSVVGTTMALTRPLQTPPAVGDAFTVYQGCDRSLGTCKAKFANSHNFRGFPFVPPPGTGYNATG